MVGLPWVCSLLGLNKCGFGQLDQLPALPVKDKRDIDVIPATQQKRVIGYAMREEGWCQALLRGRGWPWKHGG